MRSVWSENVPVRSDPFHGIDPLARHFRGPNHVEALSRRVSYFTKSFAGIRYESGTHDLLLDVMLGQFTRQYRDRDGGHGSCSVGTCYVHGNCRCNAGRIEMTREQLERQRASVEAQLRWAMHHAGDQELLELLHAERDRLSASIGQMSQSPIRRDRAHPIQAAQWPRTADRSGSRCRASC